MYPIGQAHFSKDIYSWDKLPNRSSGQTARHALILTLLRCLLPFLINLVSIITCLNTFVDLSYNLTEVRNKTTTISIGQPLAAQVISSPAFINNEYLICQNLLYVNGNSSLPVYQEAEQVTDVRCQFVKVPFGFLFGRKSKTFTFDS